jgi:hypothetical protein
MLSEAPVIADAVRTSYATPRTINKQMAIIAPVSNDSFRANDMRNTRALSAISTPPPSGPMRPSRCSTVFNLAARLSAGHLIGKRTRARRCYYHGDLRRETAGFLERAR